MVLNDISIIIPNRNHAEKLKISLAAIAQQTQKPAEVIIVDDASQDDSLAVITGFAAANPHFTVLQNPANLGVAGAVVRGVMAAKTRYIILASADERLEPNMVEELMQAMAQFPEAKLGISNYSEWYPEQGLVTVHGPDSELGIWYMPEKKTTYVSPADLHEFLNEGHVALQATTAIFDRQALIDVGIFDADLRWIGDWFAMYALAFRHGVVVVPSSLAVFRRDPTSYSGRGMRDVAAQNTVVSYLLRKLDEPHFRYLHDALARSPAAMSPFLRSVIRYCALRPKHVIFTVATMKWWSGQLLTGRRPGILRRLVHGDDHHIRSRQG